MQTEPTIHHAIGQYISSLTQKFSAPTVLAYSQALRHFDHFLRHTRHTNPARTAISHLSLAWACAYLTHLQETYSVETEHLYSRAILAFYQYAAQFAPTLDGIPSSLAIYLANKRRTKQPHVPTLPFHAIEAILNFVNTAPLPASSSSAPSRDALRLLRDKAFLFTLAHTGLRVSEICGLRLRDIDMPSNTLHLPPNLQLPIPAPTYTAITHYLTTRAPLDRIQPLFNANHLPLFARHDKKAAHRILPISRWTAANIVDFWTNAALSQEERNHLTVTDSPISPQTFRHYFVATTLHTTGDLHQTQTLARHTTPATTRRYLRYAPYDTEPRT